MRSVRTGMLVLTAVGLSVAAAASQPPERSERQSGGIQWFATWESGLREAERTGRPILLVSAAPHCAGVSGIW